MNIPPRTDGARCRTPLRVLQVVYRMDVGGVEQWLMEICRTIPSDILRFEFLVHGATPGCHEPEIIRLGHIVTRGEDPYKPFRFRRRLLQVLAEHGPFAAVHSHLALFSGWVLAAASRGGVPVRIAHAHSIVPQAATLRRHAYTWMMRTLVKRHVTCGIAASSAAGASLFGPTWRNDRRLGVMTCGFSLAPFQEVTERADVRQSLGLPTDALVIGHVGRLVPSKNQERILRIAATMLPHTPTIRMLLIGDGPDRKRLEALGQSLGVMNHVCFAGARNDIPRLLRACDRFIFPSFHEGLGLAAVEAQAAGLAITMSDVIPLEANVVPELITRLPLASSDAEWAAALLRPPRLMQGLALDRVAHSSFNISHNLTALQSCYQGGLPWTSPN